MNSLTIVAIAIVVLVAGYALYGRWLAKTHMRMVKITFQHLKLLYFPISFHPSQVQVL